MGFFSSDLTGHLINGKNEKENIKVNLSGAFRINCRLFINDKKIEVKQENKKTATNMVLPKAGLKEF